jgi:hypothetical protein
MFAAVTSNPLNDAAKREELTKRFEDVAKTFTTQYLKAMASSIVTHSIEDYEEGKNEPGLKYQLFALPGPPSEPLHTGMMQKKGDINTSFKPRHFILRNEDKNYVCDYYKSAADTSKNAIGQITLSGYKPVKFDAEKKDAMKSSGFELQPYSERRRVWVFKCETEEITDEWVKNFEVACWKARPPLNEDVVMREAFETAYWNTRWECGIWSWVPLAMNEQETFGAMCCDILYDTVYYDWIKDFPYSTRRTLRNLIEKFIIGLCAPAWTATAAAVKPVKDTVENTVKSSISPLAEARLGLKTKVVDAISGTINPPIQDNCGSFANKMLEKFLAPMTSAMENTVKATFKCLGDDIKDLESSNVTMEDFKAKMANRERTVSYWNEECPVGRARYSLHEWRWDMSKFNDCFPDGCDIYDIYDMMLTSCETVARKAIWTFTKLHEDDPDRPLAANLSEVLTKCIHDVKVFEKEVAVTILNSALSPVVDKLAKKPALELVAPLDDAIPDAFKDCLSAGSLVSDVIDEVLTGAIEAIVDGSYGTENAKLDALGEEQALAIAA